MRNMSWPRRHKRSDHEALATSPRKKRRRLNEGATNVHYEKFIAEFAPKWADARQSASLRWQSCGLKLSIEPRQGLNFVILGMFSASLCAHQSNDYEQSGTRRVPRRGSAMRCELREFAAMSDSGHPWWFSTMCTLLAPASSPRTCSVPDLRAHRHQSSKTRECALDPAIECTATRFSRLDKATMRLRSSSCRLTMVSGSVFAPCAMPCAC